MIALKIKISSGQLLPLLYFLLSCLVSSLKANNPIPGTSNLVSLNKDSRTHS